MTSDPFELHVVGCGTANYHAVQQLCRSDRAPDVTRMTFTDYQRVGPENALTCPDYAGHEGQSKAAVLAVKAVEWMDGRLPQIEVYPFREEDLDWARILPERPDGGLAFVLAGLDDWTARLHVCDDVRLRRDACPASRAVIIQIGLDKGLASLAVFNNTWDSPCPACGLARLPNPEPCIALAANGDLLRGDLRTEAAEAGKVALDVIADLASRAPARGWLNTKTQVAVGGRAGAPSVLRQTRPCVAQAGCWGSHYSRGPTRWASSLEPLSAFL